MLRAAVLLLLFFPGSVIVSVSGHGEPWKRGPWSNDTLVGRILNTIGNQHAHLIGDLHQLSNALNPMRNDSGMSWREVYHAAKAGGHQWCALQRDKWACTGSRYIKYLKSVPQFNKELYNPNHLKKGTTIFFDGNSYLAQVMYALICETNATAVYRMNFHSNDILAYYAESDVTILGIDNNYPLQEQSPVVIANILKSIGFNPIFLIVGPVNSLYLSEEGQKMSVTDRIIMYYSVWKDAVLIPMRYHRIMHVCSADFIYHCQPTKNIQHQCFPGPMMPMAERLMEHMQFEEEFIDAWQATDGTLDAYYNHTIPTNNTSS